MYERILQKFSAPVFVRKHPEILLLDLDHPDVSFGEIVSERCREVRGETQHVISILIEAFQ